MTLEAHQLACTRGERHLFADIAFTVEAGDALHIAGANGSGKTSMLRLLCGLSCPAAGEVRWNGRNVRSVREDFYRQLIYIGHAGGVKDDLAAWENLMATITLSGHVVSLDRAWQALDAVGLGEVGHLPARALSQGQRKRVALARLWLFGSGQDAAPRLWILDEPFTALDSGAVGDLCSIISAHLTGGGMLVYTTHQEITLDAGRMRLLDLGAGTVC